MVFDEKVLTALEVLTDAAENDFELYRICNLVRDLISPPKVEVIDDSHQSFNGVVYHDYKDGHYATTVQIHREIFKYYYGEIPKDYVIHHDNFISSDNVINNLVLKSGSEHQKLHRQFDRTKIFVCEYCGKEFRARLNVNHRFCSATCKKNWQHKNCYQIKKICEICGTEFSTDNPNARFCSRKCARYYQYKDHRISKICPNCGKTFSTPLSRKNTFCSYDCYNQSRHKQD